MLSNSDLLRCTWAEIDLDKIKTNFQKVKAILKKDTKLIAVVKANAYGHGAPIIAQTMEKSGADMFGVVTMGEAADLINYGIRKPIIVFGYVPEEAASYIANNDIRVTLFTDKLLSALASEANKLGKKAIVHIKLETGLTRWGLSPEEAVSFVQRASKYKEIFIEGIYSHFATADEANKEFATQQLKSFNKTVLAIEKTGITIPIKHIANAGATVDMPETHLDAVRPGIILYGYEASKEIHNRLGVIPTLQLKSKVGRVYQIIKGTPVSYGRTWYADKNSIIVTVPIGYADGYRRELSNKGNALINGVKVSIAGRVNMDTIMFDATPVGEVREGDEVVIIGQQGRETIWADDIGNLLGTNANEVLVNISNRIPRVYKENEQIIGKLLPMGSYYTY